MIAQKPFKCVLWKEYPVSSYVVIPLTCIVYLQKATINRFLPGLYKCQETLWFMRYMQNNQKAQNIWRVLGGTVDLTLNHKKWLEPDLDFLQRLISDQMQSRPCWRRRKSVEVVILKWKQSRKTISNWYWGGDTDRDRECYICRLRCGATANKKVICSSVK